MPGTSNFPAALDTFPEIGPNTPENAEGVEHDVVHQNVHAAVAALQVKVGIDASADASSLDARVAALEAETGSGVSVAVRFSADTSSTADADPGAGLLRWNHATQASATEIYLDDVTVDGVSLAALWPRLVDGGLLYLQHADDADTWQIWDVSVVTDATGYAKASVLLLADGGAFADDSPLLVTFDSSAPAGAGVGDVSGPVSSTANAVPRFDGTDGKTLKNSGVVITEADEIMGYRALIEVETGTSYTFLSSDSGKVKELTNAATITATIPATLPKGWACTVIAGEVGRVQFAMGSGGTLRQRQGHTKLAPARWAVATLVIRSNPGGTAAECVLAGDTGA